MSRAAALLAFALAACGDFTDEGSGTGTLEVEARAVYEVSDDRTDVRVDVVISSGSLESVIAELRDDETDETRTMERVDLGLNSRARFTESYSGYAKRLELRVQRGSDELDGRIEGPGRHVIEFPANGEVVETGETFDVEWSAEDGLAADSVEIRLEDANFFRTVVVDSGETEVSGAFVQRGEESVEVDRINSIPLAGGLPGSTFTVRYSVENEFVIED